MNKEELDLLEIVFTLAIGECAYNDINNIQKLEDKIKTINNLCKKQKEVIDDCKEDISNLLDIINKNCNELKYKADKYDKYKEVLDKLQQENQSLKKENKILRENTEHNDKVVDKVNWENQLLKKENKQLKDNWNKLKEWVNKHYDYYMNREDYIGGRLCFTDMKNKMKELEGSDSNE